MRVLWISVNEALYNIQGSNSYNGGGWIAGLQKAIQLYETNIELGIAFLYKKNDAFKVEKDSCTYYPIYQNKKNWLQKMIYYYGGYKKMHDISYYKELNRIIDDFKPELIHIYGIENELAYIVYKTNIPTVIHLQGLLNPYYNSFFPEGMNKFSIRKYNHSIRELLLNNNFCFAYNLMRIRKKKEIAILSNAKNVMGRTKWDYMISNVLAPNAKYYQVNEVLRDAFYTANKWQYNDNTVIEIVSTISETLYKGLDLILKSANILKKIGIQFRWQIIGINSNSEYVHLFEQQYQIKSSEVRVEYTGTLPADKIILIMQESDIYVHPSYIDNSPNSLCEAQMLGIPVIACNVGGVSTLIKDGVTGWLIPSNAPYELVYLIKHFKDLPYKQVSINEINEAERRHSRIDVVNKLFECYKQCKAK